MLGDADGLNEAEGETLGDMLGLILAEGETLGDSDGESDGLADKDIDGLKLGL